MRIRGCIMGVVQKVLGIEHFKLMYGYNVRLKVCLLANKFNNTHSICVFI